VVGDHQLEAAGSAPAEGVIDARTDVGRLWLDGGSEQVTPELLEQLSYQPALGALIRKALRPGMTFVDAGANIGYFSVLASGLVGSEGRVVCVEPDGRNVEILRANLRRNGCSNASVLPLAAWSERIEVNLMRTSSGGALTRVAPATEGDVVQADRLDDVVRGPVDFLKVDCETTDHMVVKGAAALLRANPETLITVEFHTNYTGQTGATPRQVLDAYQGLGLKPFLIRRDGSLRPTKLDSLLTTGPRGRVTVFDFALSARPPTELVVGFAPRDLIPAGLRARVLDPALRLGGVMLEHVPERIRPRIRPRDRRARALDKGAR
jgi:FkbM family methyltransferase